MQNQARLNSDTYQTAAAPLYDSAIRRVPLYAEAVELYRYRDLLVQLIARNIKTRYKRSILGILWTLLNPLLMMLVLTFVFANIFQLRAQNYAAYALSGLILWNFFSQTTIGAMSELVWGGSLMSRIYMPRSIFAATALGTGLVNLALSIIPLFVIMLVTGVPIRPALLFLPIPVLLVAMFAFGVALLISTAAAYFADILEMYQIVLIAWMYLTPIIYPQDIIPLRWRWFYKFNPMYHLLEAFRAPLYDGRLPGIGTLGASALVAAVALAVGWWFFARKADELAYRV
jgi:ABC-2 type transport system permease protein